MLERTRRNVVIARCNKGMARKAKRSPAAGACSCADQPTLVGVRLIFLALAVLLAANLPVSQGSEFLASASSQAVASCLAEIESPTPITSVHVQPESGYRPIVDEIVHARCTIDLNMYLFTDQTIVDALDNAIARGIRVRVILERAPFGTFGDQQEIFDRLEAIGAEVKWSPAEFTYSHAKYMIVDTTVLLATNQNFTGAGFNSNREFGVITTEARYLQEANAIFDADWRYHPLTMEIEHLVVSPVNSRSRIISLINSSEVSIWMYSEVLRDEEVTGALSDASDRGVNVRILVNPSADEDDAPYYLDALAHNVEIRVLRNPYVHSKLMIVDGTKALVGSQNYSYTSLNLNRELGIILDAPTDLELVTQVYLLDWSRAEPVDTVTTSAMTMPFALTHKGVVGRISFGRWGVV